MTPNAPTQGSEFLVAAVIVTYHPEVSLKENLTIVVPQVQKTVVVDNTEDSSSKDVLLALERIGCHIIKNGKNVGIGRAQNQGIQWAEAQGCSWILTLDQDTHVSNNLIQFYVDSLRGELSNKNVGIISTRYKDINARAVAGTISITNTNNAWKEVGFLISSGSFFSVDIFRKAGGFREDFFLDWVDHDFCLKVRHAGFKNYIYFQPMFEHSLGKKTRHTIP